MTFDMHKLLNIQIKINSSGLSFRVLNFKLKKLQLWKFVVPKHLIVITITSTIAPETALRTSSAACKEEGGNIHSLFNSWLQQRVIQNKIEIQKKQLVKIHVAQKKTNDWKTKIVKTNSSSLIQKEKLCGLLGYETDYFNKLFQH